MLNSKRNPIYAHMTDAEVSQAYVDADKARNPDTMTDEELDALDSTMFWLDDELCSRGLELPC